MRKGNILVGAGYEIVFRNCRATFDGLLSELLMTIFDELKGSQIRRLKQIVAADMPKEEKKRQVSEILRETDDENDILTKLLLHPSFMGALPKE